MKTLRMSLALGVVAGALAVAPAGAVDTPLSGIKLKVSDATQPGGARRKIVTVSKDAGIVVPADGGAGDPSLNGGTLEIVNTAGSGESDVIALPAGNWIRIPGDPLSPLKGWKFKQVVEDPPDDDFRIKVLLKTAYSGGVLRAVVADDRGTVIGYTLDEPSQGSIGIRLTTGADTQCVEFGGTVVVDESEDLGGSVYRGRFIAKAAPAPPDCGSPSGAFLH